MRTPAVREHPDQLPTGGPTPHIHRGVSLRSRALVLGARFGMGPAVRVWMAAPDFGWPLDWLDAAAGLLPRPRHTQVRPVALPNCSAERVSTPSSVAGRAILYLHGGAFLAGGLNTHRALVSCLSTSAGAPVLHVGYRMLPRHTIGSAVSDAVDGYRWLLQRGYHGCDIVVSGDSAGGYLAFMAALSIPRLGLPKPAGVVAISPITDLRPRTEAVSDTPTWPVFPPSTLQVFSRYLTRAQSRITVKGEAELLISPIAEDLRDLPPVMIHAGANEILRTDAERMTDRLLRSGVPCDLHVWEGQMHAFPVVANATRESRGAIRSIGGFVRDVTSAPDRPLPNRHRGRLALHR